MGAGRKPIKRVNKDPAAKIIVTAGMRGIGKTYSNHQEIKNYISTKKLPCVAYDINMDDYDNFKIVHPNYIGNITTPQSRRVVPLKKGGEDMSLKEQKEVLYQLLTKFWNGLLVLDDFDKYAMGARGQQIVGAITTNRHRGVSLMISHQSVKKISTTEWENVNILRLHHQADDVEVAKDRVNNFPLVKIAQFIVDDVYFAAMRLWEKQQKEPHKNIISMKNFMKLRGYFVYVNFDNNKIYGCSEKQYRKGMDKFFRQYPKYIKDRMQLGDDRTGEKLSRDAAKAILFKEYGYYYGGS